MTVFESKEYAECGPCMKAIIEYACGILQNMELQGTIFEQTPPAIESAIYLQGKRDGKEYHEIAKNGNFKDYDKPWNRHAYGLQIAYAWVANPMFIPTMEDSEYLYSLLRFGLENPDLNTPFLAFFDPKSNLDSTKIDDYINNILNGPENA